MSIAIDFYQSLLQKLVVLVEEGALQNQIVRLYLFSCFQNAFERQVQQRVVLRVGARGDHNSFAAFRVKLAAVEGLGVLGAQRRKGVEVKLCDFYFVVLDVAFNCDYLVWKQYVVLHSLQIQAVTVLLAHFDHQVVAHQTLCVSAHNSSNRVDLFACALSEVVPLLEIRVRDQLYVLFVERFKLLDSIHYSLIYI